MKNLLLIIFSLFSLCAHATNAEWITHQTKGHVSFKEAQKIERAIYVLSVKHEIDPNLVFKIISVESNFKAQAKSTHGAKGLMQIIPRYHKAKINKRNIYDIYTNIDVGIQIYKEYLEKYGTIDRALKAYNGEKRRNIYAKKVRSVKLYEAEAPYSKPYRT